MNQTKNKSASAAPAYLEWKRVLTGYSRLVKAPLCALIGCSAACGASIARRGLDEGTLAAAAGVMLAAMGGAALNSRQERGWDAMFSRTANRPLVQGEISTTAALAVAACAILSSLLLLLNTQRSTVVLGLTVLALLLYNLVYTPLKARTLLAIVPGAVCGGLPPLIGWVAGGGELASAAAALLFVLLFLWQVPHFCLILLLHQQDYGSRKQPTFLSSLSEAAVRRLSVVWIGSMAVVMMLFCVIPRPMGSFIQVAIVVNALGTSAMICSRLVRGKVSAHQGTFILLNCMLGIHLVLLMVGSQIG